MMPKLSEETVTAIRRLWREGHTSPDIVRTLRCSKSAVTKHTADLRTPGKRRRRSLTPAASGAVPTAAVRQPAENVEPS